MLDDRKEEKDKVIAPAPRDPNIPIPSAKTGDATTEYKVSDSANYQDGAVAVPVVPSPVAPIDAIKKDGAFYFTPSKILKSFTNECLAEVICPGTAECSAG